MKTAAPFFFALLLVLSSCGHLLTPGAAPKADTSRLLIYVHSTSDAPTDIEFTVSEILIETPEGSWVRVSGGELQLSSLALASAGQALLGEFSVPPGSYKAVKLVVSRASVRTAGGRANLQVPGPEEGVAVEAVMRLPAGSSFVASIAWDPDASVSKGYIFNPAMAAELQLPSARGLLLFVSNSGSDYISIIDRSLERVIAAVTVGAAPMGMALNSTEDLLYVVNGASRTVSVLDTMRFDLLHTIILTAGSGPADIVYVPEASSIEGKLYITNRDTNDVTVVGTASRRALKTVPVGLNPSAIAADAGRKEVYVACARSRDLHVINANDDTVAAKIPLETRPAGLAVADGYLYVFNEGTNTISVISLVQRAVVRTLHVSDPPARGLHAFGGKLFVANPQSGTLTFVNASGIATRTIRVGSGPMGLAADERRNRLYITNSGDSTVSLVEPIGESFLKDLHVGRGPYGVVSLDR
jgi:YVTN family beta-propeller protein